MYAAVSHLIPPSAVVSHRAVPCSEWGQASGGQRSRNPPFAWCIVRSTLGLPCPRKARTSSVGCLLRGADPPEAPRAGGRRPRPVRNGASAAPLCFPFLAPSRGRGVPTPHPHGRCAATACAALARSPPRGCVRNVTPRATRRPSPAPGDHADSGGDGVSGSPAGRPAAAPPSRGQPRTTRLSRSARESSRRRAPSPA